MRGSALVIGAGIAGLTTAIALLRAGWDVTVFEQAPDLGALQAGGGIHLWHNGMRVLAGLGIADQVCAVGWRQRVADFIGEQADGLEFARRIVSGSRARPLASSASLAAAREQFRVRRLLRATAAACRDRRAGLRRCADAAQYHSVEIKEFAR